MFGLIAFFLKLFFSTFFSILFSYFIIEEEKSNFGIILFAILGTSIASIVNHSSNAESSISLGILIFTLIYLSYKFFNTFDENEKILFLFPGIIGLMIGFGLIFHSIILIVFIYIAKNNLNYIYDSTITDSNVDENQKNRK